MIELYHFCAPKRIHLQVSHVTPMLVVPAPNHVQSTTATQHYLDRATFSKTTLYTDNHFRKNLFSLFQNNLLMSSHQQTQSGRKTTPKNHSQILNMRVPETCASTLPQVMSPRSLRPERLRQFRQFLEFLFKMSVTHAMYRENLENQQFQVKSSLDQEMTKMSPIKKMSYLQSRMHFDESMESNADSDLEHGEIRNLLT